ncbi:MULTISPECIES: DUF2206 domain-containing protein [unclassified Methanosarcina]|uniref:DUF2206 domain-containing protein n=1 Tax=unclassified Methanosarcina TaxID=2644672 RepID=UPI000615B28D|nr:MULTISPECIES: DUF2206 domain-containing protein [unclassified Methanosarcina]AKB19815.1 hypothetical protein MSWHS_2952 [Methanosarcina sp. WWM596]AKB22416.1 hypothetical protein MSWH1_2145 [Methanosarcina sp. WH1]
MTEYNKVKINITSIALSIQFAALGLICADIMGISIPIINIPILRHIVVFIYLAFIPGLLILSILKINLKFIDLIIFSFGLSLSFVTISALFENIIAIILNIENPISEIYLTVYYNITTFVLILLSKWKGCTFITFDRLDNLNLKVIAILFIPIFSIFGSISLKYQGVSYLLLLVLITISGIPFMSLRLKDKYYPLIIWAVSFSLLIHTNLSYAGKSFYETFLPEIVYTAGIWDPLFPYEPNNSLLTTSLMLPVFSKLMGIGIIWGVQIISWIVMAFIPVGMYQIHSKFHGCKVAFLSSFLYIFMPFYYTQEWVMYAQRTAFALLFITLFLLLVYSDIELIKKKILLPFCLFPIVASHYGAAYFFLITLTIYEVLMKIFKIDQIIKLNTYILYTALLIFWYVGTSSASNVIWIGRLILDVFSNLSKFLQPSDNYTLKLLFSTNSYSLDVAKYFNIVIIFLLFSGILLYTQKKILVNRTEYGILSISSILILVTQILPHSMGNGRLLSMVLIFASPLCIYSFLFFLKPLKLDHNKTLTIFSIFLFVFFIFGSGISSNIINTVSGTTVDYSINRQMDRLAIQESDGTGKWLLYWPYRLDSTIDATNWFVTHNSGKHIYLDWCLYNHFITHEGTSEIHRCYNVDYGRKKIFENMVMANRVLFTEVLRGIKPINNGEYLFLIQHNTVENSIIIDEQTVLKTSDYKDHFEEMNNIYNNGGNILFHTDKNELYFQ